MAAHLEPGAASHRLTRSRAERRPYGAWAIGVAAGAFMGLGGAGGYLAAVPAVHVSTASVALEPGAGGARSERGAALLAGTILSDAVLSRAATGLALTGDTAALRRRLTVSRTDGLVFEIAALGASPEAASGLSNAVAEAFVAGQAGAAGAPAPEPATPVAEARAALAEAERQLAAPGIAPASAADRELAESERLLNPARIRLAEAKARADALQAALGSSPAALGGGREPDGVAEATSPALDRLRQALADAVRAETAQKTTLGPLHPSVRETEEQTRTARRLYLDEVRRAARLAASDQAAAAARVAALEQQIAARQGSAAAALARRAALEAEVEARRRAVEAALGAAEAAEARAALAAPARVVSPADPAAARRSPDLAGTLGAGLLGGALLGFLGGFALPRRRRPDAAGEPASLPPEAAEPVSAAPPAGPLLLPAPPHAAEEGLVAGAHRTWTLPRLGAHPPSAPGLGEVVDRPGSAYSTVVGDLVAALTLRLRPGQTLTVVVASETPGAGRSTLAANLAQAFAEAAHRVVLVEASPASARGGGLNAPTFVTVRHGQAAPYQVLPLSRLGPGRDATPQYARIVWGAIRLARSAFDIAVIDAPALSASPLARGGAEAADAVVALGEVAGAEGFARVGLVDPACLAEPGLRGTLAA